MEEKYIKFLKNFDKRFKNLILCSKTLSDGGVDLNGDLNMKIIMLIPILLILVGCGPSKEEIPTNEMYLECDGSFKVFIDTDARTGEIYQNGRRVNQAYYLEIESNFYRMDRYRLNRKTLMLDWGRSEKERDDLQGFQCRVAKNKNKI